MNVQTSVPVRFATVLSLPRPMAKWRKQCGLAITHMMVRKTRALAMQFHHGARTSHEG